MDGNANADGNGGDGISVGGGNSGGFHPGPDLLGHFQGPFQAGIRQQDAEFLTPKPGGKVPGTAGGGIKIFAMVRSRVSPWGWP